MTTFAIAIRITCLILSFFIYFIFCRKNVEKKALFDHLDSIFLALDEIIDEGIVLEADPNAVAQRVSLRGDDVPITEQTMSQVISSKLDVLQSAKDQLKWSLLK
nr:coatomer subunit zeta-1-like [Lytechinus pictus]